MKYVDYQNYFIIVISAVQVVHLQYRGKFLENVFLAAAVQLMFPSSHYKIAAE
jgi:hypothetical protein